MIGSSASTSLATASAKRSLTSWYCPSRSLRNDRARVRDVAERPEALVGEAVVVARSSSGVSHTRRRLYASSPGGTAHGLRVGDITIGGAAAVGDPDARTGAHHRLERGDEAAGRVQDFDAAVWRVVVDVRLAVRNHHDALAEQAMAQRVLQPFGRPEAARSVEVALGAQPVHQIAHVADEREKLGLVQAAAQDAANLVGPAPPGRAPDDYCDERRRARQHRERPDEQMLDLRLAPLGEAEIVEQQDHAARLVAVDHRQRAEVHRTTLDLDHRSPWDPLRRRRVGGVAHVPYRHRARYLRRPIGCGREDAAVGAARGRSDEPLVVRDDRQQRPHAPRGRAGPVLGELVARAGDGEISPSGKVALEPFVQRAADEERARQDQQAEAGENAEGDAEGTGHGRSAVAPGSGVRRGPTRTVG